MDASSSGKYGGPITATPSASAAAAHAQSLTVSDVVCAPAWMMMRNAAGRAATKSEMTRSRSSTESSTPSPLVPVLLVVGLVVVLGRVEGPGRDDLGRDRPGEPRLRAVLRRLGLGLLLGR